MEKKEILQKLYTLRAGMSVVALVRDDAFATQGKINSYKKQIEAKKAGQKDAKARAEQKKKAQDKRVDDAKNQKDQAAKTMAQNSQETGTVIGGGIGGVLMLLLHYFAYGWYSGATNGFTRFLLGALFYFSVILAAGGVIGVIIGAFALISSFGEKKSDSSKVRRLGGIATRMENELDAQKAAIDKSCQAEIAKLDSDIKAIQRSINIEEENKKAIIVGFNSAYATVKKSFASFLDLGDWPYVDYIIYLFETGRAIDMRDALKQLDEEKRTARIENAVRGATAQITHQIKAASATLQKSLQELGGMINAQTRTMVKLARDAAEQSARQHAQMMGAMDSMHSESMAAMDRELKKLDQISASNRAQTALLAKINCSSNAIASDISMIKQFGVKCDL